MRCVVQSGSKRSYGWLPGLVVLGLALLGVVPAHARIFTVNFNGDQGDANVGDGVCNMHVVGAPVCTLRAAIEEANHTLAPDTIRFKANLGTIDVSNGELDIFTSMTIQGTSTRRQRIKGFRNAPDGLFEVHSGDVNFQYLILEEGIKDGNGGCIDIADSNDVVRVKYSQFLHCEAFEDGGAIENGTDLLDVLNTLFQGNAAGDDGGAIMTENDGAVRSVTLVKRATFKFNFADGDGGAMANGKARDVEQQIMHCTFIGNTADGVGGGVAHFGTTGSRTADSGITIVQTSKFKNNSANFGGAMCDGSGEGLFFPQANIDQGGNRGHLDFSRQQDFFCIPGTTPPVILPGQLNVGFARVEPDKGHFRVDGSFTLNATNGGLDLLSEAVIVTFGGFSQTIPAGSFLAGTAPGSFRFKGIPGEIVRIDIRDDGTFRAIARGVSLSDTDFTNPVPLSLQIGDKQSETAIVFDDRGRFSGN